MPKQLFVGDQVDYSAPYLTVEDGELVTKYPTNEHATAAMTWVAPLLAIAVLLAAVLLRWRRNR
jgi:hypothetical protein